MYGILGRAMETSASLETRSAPSPYPTSPAELAPRALLAPQRHAGARGASDQSVFLIVDVALDEPHRAPALDEAPRGRDPAGPDRFQEIDLELQRGECLALVERRGVRHAHAGVGQVAEDPAVDRAHGIGVLGSHLHL